MGEKYLQYLPDSPSIGPISGHASAGQQRRDWFVKEEMVIDQLLLILLRHGSQGIILPSQVPFEAGESLVYNLNVIEVNLIYQR